MTPTQRLTGAAILAGLTLGCAPLQIAGLTDYRDNLYPHRVAALASPWNGNELRDTYVLRDEDVLDIRLTPNASSGNASGVSLYVLDGQLNFVHDTFAARIPVGFLKELPDLTVASTGASPQYCRILLNEPRPRTWGDLRMVFASKTVPCDPTPDAAFWNVEVTLHPRAPYSARPGDALTLHRSYIPIERDGTALSLTATDDFHVTVDPDGYIHVPIPGAISDRYSEIGRLGDQSYDGQNFVGRPGLRRLGAAIERAYARVRVWRPENPPTLDFVSDCLSVSSNAWHNPNTCLVESDFDPPYGLPSQFLQQCQLLGIGDQFRHCQPRVATGPNPVAAGGTATIHYVLEPTDTSWTLVDESRRRVRVPFIDGQRIEDAVVQSYRALTGRELISGGARRAWLVVVPDHQSGHPTPFVFQAASGQTPLLRPRDTVFVSRTRPRAAGNAGGQP